MAPSESIIVATVTGVAAGAGSDLAAAPVFGVQEKSKKTAEAVSRSTGSRFMIQTSEL
jgi:hypothetical protein